jgi:hypothetical protein
VQRLARFGYLTKGIVYMLVGAIALQAALGAGDATGSRGALAALRGDAPFGAVALAAVAIGLFGYVIWRAYTAIADPELDGPLHRVYAAGVAVVYVGIALAAAKLALWPGSGSGSRKSVAGDGGARDWTATALAQPLGRWLVGGAAAAIVIWGIAQLVRAWRAKLDDQLELGRLRPQPRAWVKAVSRIGIAARGLVFVLVGFFLGRAAITFDASQARDPGGALRSLEAQWAWLLAVVAAGLFAYGVYDLIRARYRTIHVRDNRLRIRLERA